MKMEAWCSPYKTPDELDHDSAILVDQKGPDDGDVLGGDASICQSGCSSGVLR
jgi:hypothetical protein